MSGIEQDPLLQGEEGAGNAAQQGGGQNPPPPPQDPALQQQQGAGGGDGSAATQPTVADVMQQMNERLVQLSVDTQATFSAMNSRLDQAGGLANAAAQWAQQTGGANQQAAWAQAAQAAGQAVAANATPAPASIKLPTPAKFRGAHKEPRILEWTHQAGQFLQAAGIADTVQGVFHISTYLSEDAAIWWRLYCQRVERGEAPPPLTWWALRLLLLEQFSEINRVDTVRSRFAAIRQTGSVANYIVRFQAIVLELPDKSEADQIHQFIAGLKQQVQVATTTLRPQTLFHAMSIADSADKAIYNSGSGKSSRSSNRPVTKSNGAEPMQLGAVSLTPSERADCIRDGLCFVCKKPGHSARDCKSAGSKSKGMKGKKGQGKRRPASGN